MKDFYFISPKFFKTALCLVLFLIAALFANTRAQDSSGTGTISSTDDKIIMDNKDATIEEAKMVLPKNESSVVKDKGVKDRKGSIHASIASDSVIFDLHNDTITMVYEGEDLSLFSGTSLEASLPRLKQGGIKAAFFAIWLLKDKGPDYEYALFDIFYELMEIHKDEIAFAASYKDLSENLEDGKISAFLAIEGGKAIGEDLAKLDYLFSRGVRYMTLTWNITNAIADAARDENKPHNGLSPFGRQVVKKMNDLGMIVDVSHVSDKTVKDVLALSKAPVIASHSNSYTVRPHYRNLKDSLVKGICGSGGVIGANFHGTFLSYNKPAVVGEVADHIDQLVKVGGIDCLALGSDFDGMIKPPRGLENMGKLENLTKELVKRGYSEQDIKKIYGLNFIRVLKQVVDD